MDLSIVILNWNVCELLRRCLASIVLETRGITFEVIVVDNASSDDSVDMVRREFPDVAVIANSQNFGFAKGNNIGIKKSAGDVVLVLNPDTEVIGNALGELVQFVRSHPHAGLVGAEFINGDGSHQPSVRRFPTLLDQSLILLKLHNLFPRWRVFRRYYCADFDPTRTQAVDQVSGTFFGMPRRTIENVGLLDERFFIWFEDVDYCRRVAAAGLSVVYTPTIKIKNRGGASFAQVLAFKKQRLMNASLAAYMKKWHGYGPWAIIQIFRPLSLLLTELIDIFVYRGRPREGRGSAQLKR